MKFNFENKPETPKMDCPEKGCKVETEKPNPDCYRCKGEGKVDAE